MKQIKVNIVGSGFTITGEQGYEFKSAENSTLFDSAHGVVILGTVTDGSVTVGQEVEISVENGEPIADTIVCIEKDKVPVTTAKEGESIGICLANNTLKAITKLKGAVEEKYKGKARVPQTK